MQAERIKTMEALEVLKWSVVRARVKQRDLPNEDEDKKRKAALDRLFGE